MGHRNPRQEAFERVGGRYDVRVLEPSPAAVNDPPWFADDPMDGGEVLPIERSGATTWSKAAAGDDDLTTWCQDRWLIGKDLEPLPPAFAETRLALHHLAEKVVSPARQAANGKIGLRFTYHGFGTPFFGDDRQLRVEDGRLIVDEAPQEQVADAVSARALGDWYGFCALALEHGGGQ